MLLLNNLTRVFESVMNGGCFVEGVIVIVYTSAKTKGIGQAGRQAGRTDRRLTLAVRSAV